MRSGFLSPDDELVAYFQSPPDLCDGVESLAYWRGRRARLPWHRPRARREASRMIVVWEHRVLSALLVERGASLGARVRAGGLVAAGPLRRAARRAGFVLAAAAAAFVLVLPAVLAVELLIEAF